MLAEMGAQIRLTRLPNWQSALDRFLREHRIDPFRYGSWDCCLFVCDAIQVMTGVDVAAEFRGTYNTRAEALEAIRQVTGRYSVRSVVEHVTEAHSMAKIPVLQAQRGDIVLVRRSRRDCSLGIIALNGTETLVVTTDGIKMIALDLAIAAWRV